MIVLLCRLRRTTGGLNGTFRVTGDILGHADIEVLVERADGRLNIIDQVGLDGFDNSSDRLSNFWFIRVIL